MKAIFQGRWHFVVGWIDGGVWIEQVVPADEDMDLADAYECGEISEFEYPDGHTYPPGREIGRRRRPHIITFRARTQSRQ